MGLLAFYGCFSTFLGLFFWFFGFSDDGFWTFFDVLVGVKSSLFNVCLDSFLTFLGRCFDSFSFCLAQRNVFIYQGRYLFVVWHKSVGLRALTTFIRWLMTVFDAFF